VILDLGAGTGDLTFAAAERARENTRIVGLDVSLEMLRMAKSKQAAAFSGVKANFIQGSAMASPFKDSVFDGVMTAFVLRNVSDLSLFLTHAYRVLKPGGKFVCLDMFPPSNNWFSALYSLYFYRLVPWIGGLLGHDRAAYQYLAQSVQHFFPPETIADLIQQTGFRQVVIHRFLNGAVCVHVSEKPNIV
jgi:demethylmenaquinone methyltransferase/2-methoxy-6-polyprenyl-1,4-benzoquinol methylase